MDIAQILKQSIKSDVNYYVLNERGGKMTYQGARDRIFAFLTDNYDVIDYKDRIALLIAVTALNDKIESEVK